MKRVALLLVAAAAAISPVPAVAKPVSGAAASARDWASMVALTPEGGVRMGNPAARVKLVEYGSLVCPHCRHFAETGAGPLINRYVRSGRVSYEFRNLLLSGPDLSATLLARCGGPSKFFPMVAAIYAAQHDWQQKIANMSEADKALLAMMSDEQQIARYARISGLNDIAAKFGVTEEQGRQCLLDEKASLRLAALTQAATDRGVKGTPAFLVNGKLVSAVSWQDLEPYLRRAGAG